MDFPTRLVQIHVDDVTDAMPLFAPSFEDHTTPLVLIPSSRTSGSCCLTVPSDAHAVLQRWGKDTSLTARGDAEAASDAEDEMVHMAEGGEGGDVRLTEIPEGRSEEGMRCLCSWYRVAYLVSRQICTYNAPVQNVPTRDNVMISVNVSIVFRIIRPRDFVYTLGAMHLDELLHAAMEESIRQLVRSITVDEVYELRGQQSAGLVGNMNNTFRDFGVAFSNVTITNVSLPRELGASLEKSSMFEAKIEEEKRIQDMRMVQLLHHAEKEKRIVEIRNEKLALQLGARKGMMIIQGEEQEIRAQRDREVAIMRAEQEAHLQQTRAEAGLAVQRVSAERKALLRTTRAEYKCRAQRVAADQEAKSVAIRSETQLAKARDASLARAAEASAEERAAVMLANKRRHSVEMKRLETLERLARHGRIVLGGKDGERLMRSVLDTANAPLASRPPPRAFLASS